MSSSSSDISVLHIEGIVNWFKWQNMWHLKRRQSVFGGRTGKNFRHHVQSTFQFVSILQQLRALFSDPAFCRVYMDFNQKKDHECVQGVYRNGCYGRMYQKNPIFSVSSTAIQLQLFNDDFDPCALKIRARIHKTSAFYMQIRNLPREYLSRHNSILLVALCNANDLKGEYVDTNNILEVIADEIKVLEVTGIETALGDTLKGGLFDLIGDNLGLNVCL